MNYKSVFIFAITLLILFLLPTLVIAGPPDLGGDPGTPIDGGASLLVGAAVVYGAKKINKRKERKNKNVQPD